MKYLSILCIMLYLTACGQKGALYLPTKNTSIVPAHNTSSELISNDPNDF